MPDISILNAVGSLMLTPARLFAIIAFVVSLVACSGKPELKPLAPSDTVLAFGDSLTAGLGVSTDYAYPAVLQSLIGRTVINAGVSGELTEGGLKRFPDLLEKHDPQLVILLEGGNDILQNRSLESAKANLSAMIDLARIQGRDIVLVGVPKKSLFASTANLYVELAEEHQVPLEKSIIASLLKKPAMKSDSVHFNRAGYSALAEALQDLLTDSGAL